MILFFFAALLFYMLYKVKIINMYINKRFDWIGVQFLQTIYTLKSTIQSKNNIYFDFVLLKRYPTHIIAYLPLHRYLEFFALRYVEPGFLLKYENDGKICDIPYEEGTPFKLTQGDIIVQKRVKGRFGFVLREIARIKEWPTSLEEFA